MCVARVVPEEETQQNGRDTSYGRVGSPALGLQAQIGPCFLEGDLQLPTRGKPLQDLGQVRRQACAEEGPGQQAPSGFGPRAQRMGKADLPEQYQAAIWDTSSTMRAVPSLGTTAATARRPVARVAPTSRIWAFCPVGLVNSVAKGSEYRSNHIRQGEHGRAFREKWGQHRLPCLHTVLTTRKVQLRPGPMIWNPLAVLRHHDGGISRPTGGAQY